MAEISHFSVLLVISFGLLTIVSVQAKEVQYGPSISSLTASQPEERKGGIASKKAHQVFLEDFPDYSVVIPLLTGKSHGTSAEIIKERGTVKTKQFSVHPPKGFGIMAVIQELDLPLEPLDDFDPFDMSSKQKSCRDFIQFKISNNKSGEVCGKVDGDNRDAKASSLIGSRSFYNPNGKITVAFQHGDISDLLLFSLMNQNQGLGNSQVEYIYKLELVFTAYKNCSDQSKNSDNGFLPCEQTEKLESENCINANLFCNNLINCGSPSQFASDESNCPVQNTSIEEKKGIVTENRNTTFGTFGTVASFLSHIFQKQSKDNNVEVLPPEDPSLYYPAEKFEDNQHRNSDGSNFLRNGNTMFDNTDLHITPTGIILLIILTIATVMTLSVIVRFCCYRCVGKDPESCPSHPINANYGSTNFPIAINSPGRNQRNNHTSLVSYLDTPPAYEDLFPAFEYKAEANASPSSTHPAIMLHNEQTQSSLPSNGQTETEDSSIKTIYR